MPAKNAKKGRRHFIEGFPDNLWEWLALPNLEFGINYDAFKRRLLIAYGRAYITAADRGRGPLDKQGTNSLWRTCFASYMIALTKSAERVAHLMSHRGGVSTLYEHYRGNATYADAKRYFSIVPKRK